MGGDALYSLSRKSRNVINFWLAYIVAPPGDTGS